MYLASASFVCVYISHLKGPIYIYTYLLHNKHHTNTLVIAAICMYPSITIQRICDVATQHLYMCGTQYNDQHAHGLRLVHVTICTPKRTGGWGGVFVECIKRTCLWVAIVNMCGLIFLAQYIHKYTYWL